MFEKSRLTKASLTFLGTALALSGSAAYAQTAERIEITGSSIKRVDAESALPVSIITNADIARTGATSTQDLVNLIPSNFGGFVAASNVGATGIASTANLRSLGQKYTLVLLNGRRIANYAFGNYPVDLNSIPLAAIERVEVLRDGASAVYGADAVAGVINFILKNDYQGLEASAYGTHVDQGGGNSKVVSLTGGFGNLSTQGFNVLLNALSERDDVLKAKDRSFAGTANRPDLGINKASTRNGVPNFSFVDTSGNGYGSAGNQGTPLINPFRAQNCVNPEFALVVVDSTRCGTDYVKYIDLIPKQKNDTLVGRATFKVNENHEILAEGVYSKSFSAATYSPAPYTISMQYPASGRFYPTSITVPKGATVGVPASTDPATGVVTPAIDYRLPNGTVLPGGTVLGNDVVVTPTGPLTGTWRTVAGGGRGDETTVENTRLLLGAKGLIAGWNYDAAFTASKNKGEIRFGSGQFSYALLTPLVNAGNINVFGSQDAQSLADLLSAQLSGPEQTATSKATEFDFRLSSDLMELPAGPLGFAAGASFRKEDLSQFSYPVLASGDQVGGNGPVPGVNGDRKVLGLFVELALPIIKNLDFTLAARYDNYKNGFGTSFNKISPKASLSFRPNKDVLLRGSVGQGYRAPTLYENLRPFTTGNNTNANWSDPIRCPGGVPINNSVGAIQDECGIQQNVALTGTQALNPEKSEQYSLGIVFSPSAQFSVAVDYFDVSIKDSIQQKSEISVFSNPSQYVNNFYRYDPALYPKGWVDDGNQTGAIKGSTNPNFPIAYVFLPYENQAKIFASGLDLNAQLKQGLGAWGNAGVNLDGTYFIKHGYQYPGLPSVSDAGIYKDFGPTPRWRHALTFSYGIGDWNASLTNNYTRGYKDYTDPTETVSDSYPASRQVQDYSTWDTRVSWRALKGLELTFGIKNLTDVDPPSSRTSVNFQTGYDAQYTNPLGRTYYGRVGYKFF
jgi:iron complex outermembrane receptor protein